MFSLLIENSGITTFKNALFMLKILLKNVKKSVLDQ